MRTAGFVLAGLVVSFLLAPVVARNQWPAYGPWFTGVVGYVAQVAAPSQRIVAVGTMVFTPGTEVTVTAACDGFVGIRIFSILFGVVLLLNWQSMAKLQFVVLYLSAVVLLWFQNVARIVIAVILGAETHYGTSEMSIAVFAGVLALIAIGTRRPLSGHSLGELPR